MTKNCDFEWTLRSLDFTNGSKLLSVGLFEIKGCVNKPRTQTKLKANTRRDIATISAETAVKTMENYPKRAVLETY